MRHRRWLRWLGWVVLVLSTLALIGPFLLPLPEVEDTIPVTELAGPKDRFVEVGEVAVRYRESGSGENAIILFHGFGANARSWEPVIEDLADLGRVIAFDRVGFGLTDRPMEWNGDHPYSTASQVNLTIELMDALGIETATLIGHSAGGGVASLVAIDHPDRISALVLESPALGAGPARMTALILSTPQGQRVIRFVARRTVDRLEDLLASAYHIPGRITEEIIDGYRQPLRVEDWDRGLARYAAAPREKGLEPRLQGLDMPLLIVTGDDDTWVPTAETVSLAGDLPSAQLVVLEGCGHVAHEECPEAFTETIRDWVGAPP